MLFAWDLEGRSYFGRTHDNLIGRFFSLEAIVEWREKVKPDRRFSFDILNMDSGVWYEMMSQGEIGELDDPLEEAEER